MPIYCPPLPLQPVSGIGRDEASGFRVQGRNDAECDCEAEQCFRRKARRGSEFSCRLHQATFHMFNYLNYRVRIANIK